MKYGVMHPGKDDFATNTFFKTKKEAVIFAEKERKRYVKKYKVDWVDIRIFKI